MNDTRNANFTWDHRIRVPVTIHRVASSLLLVGFGTAKVILGYRGYEIAGTTLDWVLSIVISLVYVLCPSRLANTDDSLRVKWL